MQKNFYVCILIFVRIVMKQNRKYVPYGIDEICGAN